MIKGDSFFILFVIVAIYSVSIGKFSMWNMVFEFGNCSSVDWIRKGVRAQTAPTVTWESPGPDYLFSERTNYNLTLNEGERLVLACSARAVNTFAASSVRAAMAVTKGSAPTIAVTGESATGPFVFTPLGGTLIWDSVNGNAAGHDNLYVMRHIPLPNVYDTYQEIPATGYIQMYIESVTPSDAGLYYCTFYDGSSATVTNT